MLLDQLSDKQFNAVYTVMRMTGTWPEDIESFDAKGLPVFKLKSPVGNALSPGDLMTWFKQKNKRPLTVNEMIDYYDDCELLAFSRVPRFEIQEFECRPSVDFSVTHK